MHSDSVWKLGPVLYLVMCQLHEGLTGSLMDQHAFVESFLKGSLIPKLVVSIDIRQGAFVLVDQAGVAGSEAGP